MTSHPPLDARCDHCRYWSTNERARGECRINPPVSLERQALATWPVTDCDDFCGRFSTHPRFFLNPPPPEDS